VSILELHDVSIRYGEGQGGLLAVDGATLAVPESGTLGLVGESGCGKSSIARAIVGLVPVAGGRIVLDGRDCTSLRARNARDYRRRVQMIFQDPGSSLNPRMLVGDLLVEALRAGGQGGRLRPEAARLLDLVGLPGAALDRYPHQFSGGQRQRIAIARALAVRPDVIVTDEVTSALDVSVQATILNLLRKLQRELKLSYLFISHDLSTVKYMSDRVAVMYLGRIVEAAAADELFETARHPYTRSLVDSIPQISVLERAAPLPGEIPDPRHPPPGCHFHTRCPVGPRAFPERRACVDLDPALGASARPHDAACHFPLEPAAS
jgi:peptide/nickel transport system ATP-binding protein